MPAAIAALQAAIAADDAARPSRAEADEATDDGRRRARRSALRQRLWPMVEMLRRAHAAGEPVVWGV